MYNLCFMVEFVLMTKLSLSYTSLERLFGFLEWCSAVCMALHAISCANGIAAPGDGHHVKHLMT